jgi:hypothetical protein
MWLLELCVYSNWLSAMRNGCGVFAIGLGLYLAMSSAPVGAAEAGAPGDGAATLSGIVRTQAGGVVSDARVDASGPVHGAATTDGAGAFTLTLAPGLYRVVVSKPGYLPATLRDVTLAAGQSQAVSIALAQPDLSSLRTIGRVSATGQAGSSINVGSATTSFLGAQAFASLANPQINDVLQHVPDVNIERMGSQPDTAIIVGGAQPYETQSLIDGHPVALGQYGVWLSQYFPSFLVGGAEVQSGPGNTTPFANIAVGGTVNLLTPAFTKRQTGELVVGTDNYGSQYSSLLTTGSVGRASYVFGLGYGSNNGPYFQSNHCSVTPDNPANTNTAASVGIIQFCGDASGSLFERGELFKVKYDFSDATSFEAGFVGAQGGYIPQGISYGVYQGVTTVVECLPSQPLECTNPANAGLVGKSIPSYVWYPGVAVYNMQPIFDAQFRTTIGNNTLLLRPYASNIQPDYIAGVGEGGYAQFYSPVGTVPSISPGTPIPNGGNSLPGGGNAFEQLCTVGFNPYGYHQVNSPINTIVVTNGQEECFQVPFVQYEIDKLYGGTASFIHPMGDGYLNFTYDTHATDTFAYYSSPANIAVPDTTERYTTFSLTGEVAATRNLSLSAGLYNTIWKLLGSQAVIDQTTQQAYLVGITRTLARFDPHLALVFRPGRNVSYRLSYGTSETFPFAGQVSGLPSYQPPAASSNYQAYLLQKNPYLNPERSVAFDLGAETRLRRDMTAGLDIQDTTIHDVFEPLTFASATPNTTVTEPINVAQLRLQLATLKFAYAPPVGFGFNLSATAERAIVNGIPPSVYANGPALPANAVQICGNGQVYPDNPVCIPYLKGYGQFSYTWHNGTFASLGVDYEGVNNSYLQPPFAQVDATVRKPITRSLEFQIAFQNLLNTNNFYNLPYFGQGVPLIAGSGSGLTSEPSTYVPAPPRTVRIQLRYHLGR